MKRSCDAFGRHEADILLGTQMIAKGLDYPNVTLVGVINGDEGLKRTDFRSCETTFDLLMQAGGRSGRGNADGEVVYQVFDPDHYAVQCQPPNRIIFLSSGTKCSSVRQDSIRHIRI
jgi:primosomal protein N' (replication factor Y)